MLRASQERQHSAYALAVGLAALSVWGGVPPARAQLSKADLSALRERGAREGWTFTVAANPATAYSLEHLCGLQLAAAGDADPPAAPLTDRVFSLRSLPTAFNWRTAGGCTPVKNQGLCGGCWAFATVALLECNILIQDGVTVDLSEQWLISCNRDGYGCIGGWFAHDYHLAMTDECGAVGAVLEADAPYTATDAPCHCPYPRAYTISSWAYVGGSSTVPSTDAIKQAIVTYGPVSAAVYAGPAFQAYVGGVFNAGDDHPVNHGVALVGWDDTQGASGVWILRNSWGPNWGEQGYMRIEYGSSDVGLGACFIEYAGVDGPRIEITPAALSFGTVDVGQTATATVTVKNVGADPLEGAASGLAEPFAIIGPATYSLPGGQSTVLNIAFRPEFRGAYAATLACTGGGGASVPVTGTGGGVATPADRCADAPTISDGTQQASNVGAETELASACGGGGSADVWWLFTPPCNGTATLDTRGSNFDTVLTVYADCGNAELACNDDGGDASSPKTSIATLSVLFGQSYPVRVAGVAGAAGNIVLNLETSAAPVTLAGRVTDAEGIGLPGVELAGLPGGPETDASGNYTATIPYGFTGTIAPQKTGWLFNPPQREYASLASNRIADHYAGRLRWFTVAGRVTDAQGNGLPGALLSGFPQRVTTDQSGAYAARVDYGFTGSVTSQLIGYDLAPTQRTYDSVTANVAGQDYVGTVQTGGLQVVLEPPAAAAAGAVWRADGGDWQPSGGTVTPLSVGAHAIEYAPVNGWAAPLRDTVSISPRVVTSTTRTYLQNTYTVTAQCQPVSAGTIICSPAANAGSRYVAGTTVTLTATARSGFRLVQWVGTGLTGDAHTDSITVEMTQDRSVWARFEAIPAQTLSEVVTNETPEAAPMACGGCGAGAVAYLPGVLAGLMGMKRRRGTRRALRRTRS